MSARRPGEYDVDDDARDGTTTTMSNMLALAALAGLLGGYAGVLLAGCWMLNWSDGPADRPGPVKFVALVVALRCASW